MNKLYEFFLKISLILMMLGLFNCKKDDNNLPPDNDSLPVTNNNYYSSHIAGTYYCERVDYFFKNNHIEEKESLDTLDVISIQDSVVKIDDILFHLESKYQFYNNFNSQGFSFSGYFINDSIYYNNWCICQSGFNIKGKRKN